MARGIRLTTRPIYRFANISDVDRIQDRGGVGVPPTTLLGRDLSLIADAFDDIAVQAQSSSVRRRPASLAVRSLLEEVEDRRLWSPDSLRARPRGFRQWRPQILAAKIPVRTKSLYKKPAQNYVNNVQYKYPAGVVVCVRRKLRQKAILASGKGGGKHRRPRSPLSSQIWC
ncbi:hypothetical protein [robinz microvirus RP_48]|nr:hypothetical protein [robinz microvirus RP_48]